MDSKVISILDSNPSQRLWNGTIPTIKGHGPEDGVTEFKIITEPDPQEANIHYPTEIRQENMMSLTTAPKVNGSHTHRKEELSSDEDTERREMHKAATRMSNVTYSNVMEKAMTHSLAQKVGKMRLDSKDRCGCCGLYADIDPLAMCINTKHLVFLGPTIPMYFDWVKRCCFLLLILLLGSGLHNLMINYNSTRCHENERHLKKHGHHGHNTSHLELYRYKNKHLSKLYGTDYSEYPTSRLKYAKVNSHKKKEVIEQEDDLLEYANYPIARQSTSRLKKYSAHKPQIHKRIANSFEKRDREEANKEGEDDEEGEEGEEGEDGDEEEDNRTAEQKEADEKFALFPCLPNTITRLSLANGLTFDRLIERTLTWACYQVVIMCYLLYLKFRLAKKAEHIDSSNPSPSDYSVFIQNLPTNMRGKVIKEKLKKMIESLNLTKPKPEIKQFTMFYHVDHHKKEIHRPKKMTGDVILTFQNTESAHQVLELYRKRRGSVFARVCCFFLRKDPLFVMRDASETLYKLKLEKAPEPTDIKWQNFGISSTKLFWLSRKTDGLAIVLFACSFFVLKFLHMKDISLHSHHDEKESWVSHYGMVVFLALVILVCELIGEHILIHLVKGEAHMTKTSQELRFIKRCVLYRTVNALLLPLALQLFFAKSTLFMPHGFVVTQFFLFFILNLIDPLLFIADLGKISNRFKLRTLKNEVEEKKRKHPKGEVDEEFRKEVFKLSEPSSFPIGERYANAIVSIFGATTFSTISPVFLLMALISLIINYWIEKYILLRRSKNPKALGTQLPVQVTDILEYILALSCVLNYIILFIVYEPLKTDKDEEAFKWSLYITHVCVAITAFYLIINNTNIIQYIFDDEVKDDEKTETYDEARKRPEWMFDYDRLNPATRDRALAAWLAEQEEAQDSPLLRGTTMNFGGRGLMMFRGGIGNNIVGSALKSNDMSKSKFSFKGPLKND
eukprot:TRINITY_DN1107_c0_g1_i6.p1 TRINITY_DN1107_c0_g1~~TRINITY_DN1107_c0_g1_i6.p1  ORF type:complete len:959 (-),score=215.56 TRINITY_DN1107_c0_g1_i6:85-2961(-)